MDRGMSLPTGRGGQRVRSWGRTRKRDEAGRPRRRGERDVKSISRMLLSKDSTNGSGIMVNGGKYMANGISLSIQYFLRPNERRS